MIIALLILAMNGFLDLIYNALPAWNFHISAGGAIAQVINYAVTLDKFLPITAAAVPIFAILSAQFAFQLIKKIVVAILNAVRGSGVRA